MENGGWVLIKPGEEPGQALSVPVAGHQQLQLNTSNSFEVEPGTCIIHSVSHECQAHI